jgi:hypothetical protein
MIMCVFNVMPPIIMLCCDLEHRQTRPPKVILSTRTPASCSSCLSMAPDESASSDPDQPRGYAKASFPTLDPPRGELHLPGGKRLGQN